VNALAVVVEVLAAQLQVSLGAAEPAHARDLERIRKAAGEES